MMMVLVCLFAGVLVFLAMADKKTDVEASPTPQAETAAIPTHPPAVTLQDVPVRKLLPNTYIVSQTFNNCAPAALSMALSYYGIYKSQETLADDVRPNHNRTGKNDDKSTPPPVLATEAEKFGLVAYFRPNGTIDLLKQLIANDIPVVVRTLLHADEDFAHYRVVKGYDDSTQQVIQDDSYQGKNVHYSYDDFLALWQPFNYAYLILVPPEKQKVVEAILGADTDSAKTWHDAVATARRELAARPGEADSQFNLSVALYYTGDYKGSTEAFEKMEDNLSLHTLWYQTEPIRAYFELGNYGRVFSLTDRIFKDGNPASTELHLLRGHSYLQEGNRKGAKTEFEQAVLYNKNSAEARTALDSVTN